MDRPVKKLGYVGKETVKKLSKLQIAGFSGIEKGVSSRLRPTYSPIARCFPC